MHTNATVNQQTITLTGASGAQYSFNLYSKSLYWKSVPGVYIILRKNISGKYDPIYVGETEDLGDRIPNHHKLRCFERNGWTHLGFHYEDNSSRRLYIENDILQNYNWVCND